MGWNWLLGTAVALVLTWAIGVFVLAVLAQRRGASFSWSDMVTFVPDLIRLLRSLRRNARLPRSARWALTAVLAYLLLPFDLVPDIVPIVGYADDVLVLALGLKVAVRAIGPDALESHWVGSAGGLQALRILTGTTRPTNTRPNGDLGQPSA